MSVEQAVTVMAMEAPPGWVASEAQARPLEMEGALAAAMMTFGRMGMRRRHQQWMQQVPAQSSRRPL